jgi:4-hydroxy-tetrahydrodipicolinate synthase
MPNTFNGINFQGVWVDALTPLQENLSIDETKLCAHIRNLCAKGIEQFVLFGQAGEGASFSSDEKLSAVSHVMASGLEAKNILLGVQSSSFSEAAQCIRKAYDLGVRRFLVSGPLHGQPFTHLTLFEYVDQLIQRVDHDDWQLFVHQLGGLSHAADFPEVTLNDLHKVHPRICVGVVDQDVHINHTVDLIRSFGETMTITSCHEPNLSVLKLRVCVSAFANLIPHVVQHLLINETTHIATQIPGMKVAKPDDRVVELLNLLGSYPTIAALKLLLAQHYRMESWERVRPPQSALTKEAKNALLNTFKAFNLQANE